MAGGVPAAEAEAGLHHATACEHCGPLLREAAEACGAVEFPELSSGTDRGRRQLARRLSRLQRGRPGSGWAWRAGLAGVAAAAIVLLIVWLPGSGRAFVARRLLNQAYGQQRTLALRFAGAQYGPLLSPRRGGRLPASADLLEAEGLLATALERQPENAALLQSRAHAELLRQDFASAIADLTRALALDPSLAGGHTDLGTGYYLSAMAGRDADYGTALNELGQTLAKSPRDPIALFNRALVEEAMQDWTGAIQDWGAYLQVDAGGSWAAEARRHFDADRQRVGRHDHADTAPLLPPGQFAAGRFDDARIEDYLQAATTDWLPAAYPEKGAPDGEARRALQVLAGVALTRHHDAWLKRLLAEAPRRPSRRFAAAVAGLAQAVRQNHAGQADQALGVAQRAAAAFAESGDVAGEERAAYEQVYVLHLAERGGECLEVLHQQLAPAALRGEAWLAGEAALEEFDCRGMSGRQDPAAIRSAIAIATAAHYPALRMRALAYQFSDAPSPDSSPAWGGQLGQLRRYWEEPVNAYRAYQLDMVLAIYSQERGEWFAADRLAEAAVDRLEQTPEITYLAMAHQQLATYAEQCGFSEQARRQRQVAEELFQRLPPSATTANLRAYNQLRLAAADMEGGDVTAAHAQLARFRAEQPAVVSVYSRALPYFTVLARWDMGQDRLPEAEANLRAAVAIRESDLSALTSGEDRLSWEQTNLDAYREWVEVEWEAHHDPAAALEYWEWARGAAVRAAQPLPSGFLAAARSLDATGAPALPRPHLVRDALASLTAAEVVSYDLRPDHLLIWVYDNRGVHGVRVAVSGATLEAEAHAFAAACSDPRSDPRLVQTEARQLYARLLQPVGAWLDPARLLVVEPDGALGQIPFAALLAPNGGVVAQPLMQSPGIAFARLARTGLPPPTARFLAVANPSAGFDAQGDPYPLLPAAAAEGTVLAAAFAPRSELLLGADATRTAVLAALPHAGIFHFAGHADGASLLLAASGTLTAADLNPATLPQCRLAVFAACSTAGGTLLDPTDLVRAALRAGVPQVVASKWAVDSAATQSLFQSFYSALRAGANPARALFKAQQQLRRRPATAAPFYWAAFTAFGARMP
jgi:CHAT domain-containing protein